MAAEVSCPLSTLFQYLALYLGQDLSTPALYNRVCFGAEFLAAAGRTMLQATLGACDLQTAVRLLVEGKFSLWKTEKSSAVSVVIHLLIFQFCWHHFAVKKLSIEIFL